MTWFVGDRSSASAFAFCKDLSKRVPANAQITSDGLASYRWAVGCNLPDSQFSQLVKTYGADDKGWQTVTGAIKMPVYGDPDPAKISTSFIESSNLHLRMGNKRYARLSNAHSKKLENHCHMLAIGFMHYNFARKHSTLGQTPAQAAGVEEKRWSVQDIVEMVDAYHDDKLNAQFEAAFAKRFTWPRNSPKSYKPGTPDSQLPWYLDPNTESPPEGLDL